MARIGWVRLGVSARPRRDRRGRLAGPQEWRTRTIRLIGDEPRAREIAAEWEQHGWLIVAVVPDEREPGAADCWAITVAVPPSGTVTPYPSSDLEDEHRAQAVNE